MSAAGASATWHQCSSPAGASVTASARVRPSRHHGESRHGIAELSVRQQGSTSRKRATATAEPTP
eukprot:6359349-Alexandrium_andersonii.AAC.1